LCACHRSILSLCRCLPKYFGEVFLDTYAASNGRGADLAGCAGACRASAAVSDFSRAATIRCVSTLSLITSAAAARCIAYSTSRGLIASVYNHIAPPCMSHRVSNLCALAIDRTFPFADVFHSTLGQVFLDTYAASNGRGADLAGCAGACRASAAVSDFSRAASIRCVSTLSPITSAAAARCLAYSTSRGLLRWCVQPRPASLQSAQGK
jgi:hypothetical protein